MDILNFRDLKIKRNTIRAQPNPQLKFRIYAQNLRRWANLSRSKRQILLARLQQIGLFTLAGAADI